MNARSAAKTFIVIVSITGHVVVSIKYLLAKSDLAIPEHWGTDAIVILFFSLTMTILGIFFQDKKFSVFSLFVRSFVAILFSIPFLSNQSVVWILLSALLLECSFKFSSVASIFFFVYLIFMVLLSQLESGTIRDAWSMKYLDDNIPFFLLVLIAIMVGRLLRALINLYENEKNKSDSMMIAVNRLTSANTAFLEYANSMEKKSTTNERKRITRELHDVVGQVFTNITSMMDAATRNPLRSTSDVNRLMNWTRQQAQQGLQEIRGILYELRAIKDPEVTGLHVINNLINTFQRSTGVNIAVEWGNTPLNLDRRLTMNIYRIIQEAMTNSLRHGSATEIKLNFWQDAANLQVIIWDNGKGVKKTQKKGIGQIGMEERIDLCGGTIDFGNTKNGYEVRVIVPLVN